MGNRTEETCQDQASAEAEVNGCQTERYNPRSSWKTISWHFSELQEGSQPPAGRQSGEGSEGGLRDDKHMTA